MTALNEFNIIETFFQNLGPHRKDVEIGIGDDAAVVIPQPGQRLVLTIDTLCAGVHFPLKTHPADIAYKALAVNLSDLAAMGAQPAWITLALTLPRADKIWLKSFSRGLSELLQQYHIALIGGDLTQGPLTVSIQAHGWVPRQKVLTRSAAKIGDAIYVSGTLGDAALALAVSQGKHAVSKRAHAALMRKLNRPKPRVALGIALRGIAHSAIDISDGLASDLTHILAASHVGATIDVEALPMSATLKKLGKLDYALRGGDDYELCFTVPANKTKKIAALAKSLALPLTRIGTIEAKPGLRIMDKTNRHLQIASLGYQHFKNTPMRPK